MEECLSRLIRLFVFILSASADGARRCGTDVLALHSCKSILACGRAWMTDQKLRARACLLGLENPDLQRIRKIDHQPIPTRLSEHVLSRPSKHDIKTGPVSDPDARHQDGTCVRSGR